MSEQSTESSPLAITDFPLEQAEWLIDATYPYVDAEPTLETTVEIVPPLDYVAQAQRSAQE